MTDTTAPEQLPQSGGSYVRDDATGEIRAADPIAPVGPASAGQEPAPEDTPPEPAPVKRSGKSKE
jgi:hypothetical protein